MNDVWPFVGEIVTAYVTSRNDKTTPKLKILMQYWVLVNCVIKIDVDRKFPISQNDWAITLNCDDIFTVCRIICKCCTTELLCALWLFNQIHDPFDPFSRVDAENRATWCAII